MGSGRLTVVLLAGLVLAGLGVWGSAGDVSTERVPGERGGAPGAVRAGGSEPARGSSQPGRDRTDRAVAELRRVVTAGPGEIRLTQLTLGESVRGRSIRARAFNGLGRRPLILVVGCIHGNECAAAPLVWTTGGCPPAGDGLVVVPSLNPDGRSSQSRTNARGVDLNRNFASGWRLAGERGDPEYSGPRPFSEPETRIARRLIDGLRPDVTIWFHQQAEPMVRAWGPSVPAARRYARLAGLRFRRLPWLNGTAPRWQNAHRPGTSSFVVELPLGIRDRDAYGHVAAISRLAEAIDRASG